MKKVFVDTSAFLALLNKSDTWHKKAKEIELFLNQNRYLWVTTDFIILELGDALYESRQDKDWGLTDCISFVIMQRKNITKAFTTDKHFEQSGFIRLLK